MRRILVILMLLIIGCELFKVGLRQKMNDAEENAHMDQACEVLLQIH